ncbi:DNA-directed RNA polymerase subunit omega [Neoehrlichia mikurensis]|uniref:DNA-directed RNA polymerase subunit omega n=1 Tax=Neoehrlichia mikurensis TaxID=89586 RepID=A0A9Q9BUB8_9RICK|nr:DNA-directed RNA polymerase subunit omega [Neoehrlichia mikurensis]QXK92078.1 DNA-directed RNA polymerase subunit omega [Neoehrlichia mikurensis]QXK92535.1 DNA-directed RNA polymerase subunit omega [Neoehrlichia mikurensis]QXK93771.1 DNA-directed RNA polymerase subunit omega [Neoehrlichia mikurensis]UTO55253.1 DNA-directed RNA polymerase subunit omega [Neoehrlichia mikurensis]UTO56174.1 DNA-directed RNA polymerase subunit omega [Neoehrlichia mikurensis]
MKKTTIEDCSYHSNNRFKLVILASQRAHELSSGSHSITDYQSSKNTVIALHEITEQKLNINSLFNLAVQRCKKYLEGFITTDNVLHNSKQDINIFNNKSSNQRNIESNFISQDQFLSGKNNNLNS